MSQLDTVPTDFAPAIGIAPAEGLESEEGGRIVLEGLPNTRDVGGLPTDDGRYVKHARLLRSGALDHATARDLEVLLDDYQVRTVIDLRTEEERKEHPDPQDGLMGVRFADAPVLSASTFGVTREGGMMQALKMLRTVQKNPASIMEEVYERMMLDEQSQRGFAQFFDDVLALALHHRQGSRWLGRRALAARVGRKARGRRAGLSGHEQVRPIRNAEHHGRAFLVRSGRQAG